MVVVLAVVQWYPFARRNDLAIDLTVPANEPARHFRIRDARGGTVSELYETSHQNGLPGFTTLSGTARRVTLNLEIAISSMAGAALGILPGRGPRSKRCLALPHATRVAPAGEGQALTLCAQMRGSTSFALISQIPMAKRLYSNSMSRPVSLRRAIPRALGRWQRLLLRQYVANRAVCKIAEPLIPTLDKNPRFPP